ncbi:HesB/IscA family protein [Priestia koreensis]|uniref:HesB/IscA family protein n=1 Tax=Priestia koreensis TaxID=284581 RepID=UPI003457F57D
MMKVTERAANYVQALHQELGEEGFLRIRIKSECCNQYQYSFSLALSPQDGDVTEEISGITVLVNQADWRYMKDIEVDVVDGEFIVHNPHPLLSL